MRFVRYSTGGPARIGMPVNGGLIDIGDALRDAPLPEPAPPDIFAFLDQPRPQFEGAVAALEALARRLAADESDAGRHAAYVPASAATILPPVEPRRVFCTWVNYGLAQFTPKPMTEPLFFCKFAESVTGAQADIVLPAAATRVIIEPELAVVIGKAGRSIAASAVFDHIAGYTMLNDVTALDFTLESLTGASGPYMMGKNFASFAPVGPWLVTRDEVDDYEHLRVRSWLDDRLSIDTVTHGMHFPLPHVVSYLSNFFELLPGDIISLGCPALVPGARTDVRRFLQAGDRVRVEIEGLGTQSNRVVQERSNQ